MDIITNFSLGTSKIKVKTAIIYVKRLSGGLMAFHKGVIIDSGCPEFSLLTHKREVPISKGVNVGGGCFLELEQQIEGCEGRYKLYVF